jgi:hypothetical protein
VARKADHRRRPPEKGLDTAHPTVSEGQLKLEVQLHLVALDRSPEGLPDAFALADNDPGCLDSVLDAVSTLLLRAAERPFGDHDQRT